MSANAEYKQFDETVEHIISTCPILAKEQCIQRHDTVCTELHCNICRGLGGKLYSKELCGQGAKLVYTGREGKFTVF
jgi:hypothetical protein